MHCPKGKANCDCHQLPVIDLGAKPKPTRQGPQRGRGRPKGTGNRSFVGYNAVERHGAEGAGILRPLVESSHGQSLAKLRQIWKQLPKPMKELLKSASPQPIKTAVQLSEALAAMRTAPQSIQSGGAITGPRHKASCGGDDICGSDRNKRRGPYTVSNPSAKPFRVPKGQYADERALFAERAVARETTMLAELKAIEIALETATNGKKAGEEIEKIYDEVKRGVDDYESDRPTPPPSPGPEPPSTVWARFTTTATTTATANT